MGAAVKAVAVEAAGERTDVSQYANSCDSHKTSSANFRFFKNFNCIVETVKENRSLTKQSENGNHFNLDSNSIRIDNVYFC